MNTVTTHNLISQAAGQAAPRAEFAAPCSYWQRPSRSGNHMFLTHGIDVTKSRLRRPEEPSP